MGLSKYTTHSDPKLQFAEDATGMREHPHGFGQIYDKHGQPLTHEEAQDALIGGQPIHVPNAGAGSYEAVLEALGYTECDTYDQTSSAGEWSLVAYDGMDWYAIYQSNRYPGFGFTYQIALEFCAPTKAELFAQIDSFG